MSALMARREMLAMVPVRKIISMKELIMLIQWMDSWEVFMDSM